MSDDVKQAMRRMLDWQVSTMPWWGAFAVLALCVAVVCANPYAVIATVVASGMVIGAVIQSGMFHVHVIKHYPELVDEKE